jgi:hypothetical protein
MAPLSSLSLTLVAARSSRSRMASHGSPSGLVERPQICVQIMTVLLGPTSRIDPCNVFMSLQRQSLRQYGNSTSAFRERSRVCIDLARRNDRHRSRRRVVRRRAARNTWRLEIRADQQLANHLPNLRSCDATRPQQTNVLALE